MLVIRLFRTGKKNQPFYKIVVTNKKNAPSGGRFVESLGYLNPFTKENSINGERAKYWISVGAKPSDTIYNLLIKKGVIKGKKIALHKIKPVKEEEKKEGIKTEVKTEEVEEKPVEKAEEKVEEKVEEKTEETKEENKVEEIKEEVKPEAEEKVEEKKVEEKVEENKEEKVEEDAGK